ncbi:MAG: AAA family ATPase [Puia sp.]|nr:AAA family ATPase [Puia sp.]
MIESIEISRCASYGDTVEEMRGLKAVNFMYGSNGAGKTTISRLIADTNPQSGCAVHWEHGTKLDTLVYNRDFVHANFNQSIDFKGIFTLGQKNIETENKIEQAKKDIDKLGHDIETLSQTLGGVDGNGGKAGELQLIESQFRDACWEIKIKHDDKLQEAMTGYRKDKQKFKEKLVAECTKTATTPPPSQSDIESNATSVFGPTPTIETPIPALNDADFLKWESDPVLARRVLGKTDVDIAAMIQKLRNSDWVKQGIPFFESNEGTCPFCQQKAPAQLAASLEDYFDEAFLRDSQTVIMLQAAYKLEGERLQQTMQTALSTASHFLDLETVAADKAIFDSRFQLNLQRIETKAKEPSQIITLEPLGTVLATVKSALADANLKIQAHNSLVSNLSLEKLKLTNQVWTFFAQVEIAVTFKKYATDKKDVEAAITSLRSQIEKKRQESAQKESAIQSLEKSVTSVSPSVNDINKLLQGFGFKNFSIEATDANRYRLRRADGSDAKDTLSEGERSFITFLYFYHLLKGSYSESGMTRDRVVVFDDPVSSLDSDVLFVVSSLIKQTIEEVRSKKALVKQVFVLTHNVYFYKEITFVNNRNGGDALYDDTFWTVHKINGISSVKNHSSNPIKTSYDLLWSELRDHNLANQGLQNTMRRILENYFRILGGVSFDDIVEKFNGEEKLICRSLLSWVHAGSHGLPDDIFHTLDEATMERYLAVFQKVFVRMGHTNHYNMMMGLPYVMERVVGA